MGFFSVDLDKRRDMILNDNVFKTILLLSIPTLMMSVVQSLIPFTDGLFLNKILGTDVGAAISYIQPALNILLSISQGIGVVAMSMIGNLNGNKDDEGVRRTSLQILIFGFAVGILLIPLCLIGSVYLAPEEPRIRDYAIIYFAMSSLIIPFQFMAAIFNSIKNATGEPEATFYRMVVLLVLKVLFNALYLIKFGLGIEGAIFASVSAYFLTTVWMVYDLFVRKYKFRLSIKGYRPDFRIIKELMKFVVPASLSFMTVQLGFLLINMEVVDYGPDVLAGLAIASQITNISFLVPTCIGTTVTTMVSINLGSHNMKKSRESFHKGVIIGMVLAAIVLVLTLYYAESIVKLYEPSEVVKNLTLEALRIYIYSVFPFGIFMICAAVYNALGKNVVNLLMSLLRIWVFRYLFIILTEQYLGYYSVFYGNLLSNTLACIIFYILVVSTEWKSKIKV